jgi:membrane fusion protein (multidrug efflux system)
VKAGDPLFRLEKAPFEAALAQQDAAVALAEARAEQTELALARAMSLLGTPASLRAALDDARANQAAAAASLRAAQALRDGARINLAYTDITAPFAGRIGRARVSTGAAVGPGTGPLADLVSQDPMHVSFPVSVRSFTELQQRYAARGGMAAVRVRLRLADGTAYDQPGEIDFTAPSVNAGTDSILLRARLPNPARRLIDGAFVNVSVEGSEPVQALTIPRRAILADVRGNYAWVVGAENKVERRNVRLGTSTAETAVIEDGLKPDEMVIVDGMQRARPGIVVNPAPVAPPPAASTPVAR